MRRRLLASEKILGRKLLVWRWSEDFDTPSKRKRHKLKFAHVTSGFSRNGDHPAIGDCDISDYLERVFEEFGAELPDLPFSIERHDKCVVFNYRNSVRFDIVPVLGNLAMSMGLNASEF